jgi:microcystin degradation protein MlrC
MKRVSGADIIVLYKEFPHTDFVERWALPSRLLGGRGARFIVAPRRR